MIESKKKYLRCYHDLGKNRLIAEQLHLRKWHFVLKVMIKNVQ